LFGGTPHSAGGEPSRHRYASQPQAYAGNDPSSVRDPLGLYATIEQAGAAGARMASALTGMTPGANEYGGLIYQTDCGGEYYITPPVQGGPRGVDVDRAKPYVPDWATVVGDYHSHPNPFSMEPARFLLFRPETPTLGQPWYGYGVGVNEQPGSDNPLNSGFSSADYASMTNDARTGFMGRSNGTVIYFNGALYSQSGIFNTSPIAPYIRLP
jgi:hypothetical protein